MKKITWLSLVTLATLVFLSFNPNPSLAAQNSATFQIINGSDDVNQDGTTFKSHRSTIWLGNTTSTTSSYTGLRFTNVSLPKGATITSAQLQVYSSQSQWISMAIQVAGDLSANSAAFSSTNLPGQRGLTTSKVTSTTDTNWSTNTWYYLPDITSVIQELVNQAGWQSGNSLSVIIKGTGNAYARKFVSSYEGSSTNSVKLAIIYQTGSVATSTPPATPTSLPTTTRTLTPIRTTIPSATPTIAPSSTSTPAPTTTTGLSITTFGVNPGGSDVIPHQLIRTSDDRLYFFGYAGNGSTTLDVYWTTSPGLPGSTGDFSGKVALTYPANIISVSPAYDGASTVHIITNSTDGALKDVPFNLSSNSFKPARVLDTGLTSANIDVGTSGVSAAFDATGKLNVAYWSGNNHILYRAYQYNPSTDTLTNGTGPTQVDSAGSANHPNLAVSPTDNSLTIAWVSQAASPATLLTRTYKAGAWGAIQAASTAPVWTSPNSGINIDQGPSLVIDTSGVKTLAYIEEYRTISPYDYGRVHVVVDQGSGWNDTYAGFYTHDPALAIDNKGNTYIIGHGYPFNPSPCNTIDNMCVYVRNTPGNWTPKLIAAPTGSNSFDSSPSTKWSVVGNNRADTVEFVFPEAINGSYVNTLIHYGRINPAGGSPTSTPAPTATPTTGPAPSATPSPTLGLAPTFTPPAISLSQLNLQITQPADDANQDGTTLSTNESTIWVGNGASTIASFTGLRFNNVIIPNGATIKSALLMLYSSQDQWISININITGDLSANSSAWSTTNLPSQRTLTSAGINSATDVNWSVNTWYYLPDITTVVQEIVNQSSWQSGNSLSIIINGTGSAYARKFATSEDGSPAFAPKLIITYQ
jgi:hypothetical protein